MKLSRLAAAVALSSVVAAPAFAVDGAYSTTQSQGSTVINANIGNLVKISNIDDPITLLPDAGGNMVHTDNICLFRNGADNQALALTFNSSNGVGAFTLTSGANTVNYTVAVSAGTFNGNVSDNVVANAAGASDNLPVCTASGGDNASYTLTIPAADVNTATPGAYTDTLTITVAPI